MCVHYAQGDAAPSVEGQRPHHFLHVITNVCSIFMILSQRYSRVNVSVTLNFFNRHV